MSHRLIFVLLGVVLVLAALMPFLATSRSAAVEPAAMVSVPGPDAGAAAVAADPAACEGKAGCTMDAATCDQPKHACGAEKAAAMSADAGGSACPFSKPAALAQGK